MQLLYQTFQLWIESANLEIYTCAFTNWVYRAHYRELGATCSVYSFLIGITKTMQQQHWICGKLLAMTFAAPSQITRKNNNSSYITGSPTMHVSENVSKRALLVCLWLHVQYTNNVFKKFVLHLFYLEQHPSHFWDT